MIAQQTEVEKLKVETHKAKEHEEEKLQADKDAMDRKIRGLKSDLNSIESKGTSEVQSPPMCAVIMQTSTDSLQLMSQNTNVMFVCEGY